MPAEPQPDPKILEAIQDISEKAALLVREEIELARAEVEAKVKFLIKGAVVATAAGVFVSVGLLFLLHGFAFFFWYEGGFPDQSYFWGYFIVAAILFLLGALGGWLATKAFKSGSPPTPQMAIDEAQKIRETIESTAKPKDSV